MVEISLSPHGPRPGSDDVTPYHITYVLTHDIEYAQDLPRFLWKYTSTAGLAGILANRTLWGTNCLFLNDAKEFKYAGEVIKLVLADIIDDETTVELRDELVRLQNLILSAHPDVTPALYICSFTSLSDDLTMWTRYTKPRDAFNVGIDGMYLLMHGGLQSWHLRQCLYDVKTQRMLVDGVIRRRLQQLKDGDQSPHTFVQLAYDIGSLAPQIKEPIWEHEKEWRLIRYPRELVPYPEPHDPVVRTRVGELGETPYITYTLDAVPTLRVTLGPGPVGRLSANDVIVMGASNSMIVRTESSRISLNFW